MKVRHAFRLILLLAAFECSCKSKNDIIRKVASINTIKQSTGISVPYSIFDLSVTPNANASLSVFQSPGFKIIHCDLSQVTAVTSTDVVMALTIQNRFGSRFSKNQISQVYLSVYYEIIKATIETSWTTYITSQTNTAYDYLISSKTSGISVIIKIPSTDHAIASDILIKFYELLKTINITDTIIKNAFTSSYQACMVGGFTKSNTSSVSLDAADTMWRQALGARQDATLKTGFYLKDEPGCPCGGIVTYNGFLVNQEMSNTEAKEYIKYLHDIILSERSFILFSASKNSIIKNSLLSIGQTFITRLSPVKIENLDKPFFGDSISRGVSYAYDQAGNTGSGGLAGLMCFGKVSLKSLLAAGLLSKKVSDGAFTEISSGSGRGIFIYGGTVQPRFSIANSWVSSQSLAWSNFATSVYTRYSSSSNYNDFTNNTAIIGELLKHFSPGSSNGCANFLTDGLREIYYDTPSSYVVWLEIFYGFYDILKQLNDLNNKTNQYKETQIKDAVLSIIINESLCSSPQAMYIRII